MRFGRSNSNKSPTKPAPVADVDPQTAAEERLLGGILSQAEIDDVAKIEGLLVRRPRVRGDRGPRGDGRWRDARRREWRQDWVSRVVSIELHKHVVDAERIKAINDGLHGRRSVKESNGPQPVNF